MAHLHRVYDTDTHFTINPVTRQVKIDTSAKKTALIQHDHNSERFSFDLPRYIDGHDMLLCDRVEVHYINIDGTTKEQRTGLYEVDDLQEGDCADMLVCSWLITQNATQLVGTLNFVLRFCCTVDGVITYAWSTAISENITVSAGLSCAEEIVTEYPDIVAQWRAELFEAGGDAVHNVQTAQADALAAIEAAGANITGACEIAKTELRAALGNAIKGELEGGIVTAADVSPVPHEMAVKVKGKNLFDISKLSTTPTMTDFAYISEVGDNYLTVHSPANDQSNGYVGTGKTLREVCTALRAGDICTLTAETESARKYIYLAGAEKVCDFGTALTITEQMLDSIIVMYGSADEDVYCKISNIQIELGDTATPYTPYIDPTTVKVRVCGKNLLSLAGIPATTESGGVTGTFDGDVLTLNGTASADVDLFRTLTLIHGSRGERYTISVKYLSGTMTGGGCHAYLGESEDKNTVLNWIAATVQQKDTSSTGALTAAYIRSFWLYAYQGTVFSNYRIKVQLEKGATATEYEARKPAANYTPESDGSVSGVMSVSPNMTLLTDTEGMTVECEYNRDTNVVIDKIVQAIEALGGTI